MIPGSGGVCRQQPGHLFVGANRARKLLPAELQALALGFEQVLAVLCQQSGIFVGASADAAEKAELHTTRKVDGLMRMEQLQGLAVAPGERVVLAPGGTHLMLLELAYMPAPGDDVQLCLQLAGGGEVCTTAEVRGGSDGPDAQDHQHH